MRNRESGRKSLHCNWIAIFSYAASLVFCVAAWRGVFWAVGQLVR